MGSEEIDALLSLFVVPQPIRVTVPRSSKSRLDRGNGVAVDRCPVQVVYELTDYALGAQGELAKVSLVQQRLDELAPDAVARSDRLRRV